MNKRKKEGRRGKIYYILLYLEVKMKALLFFFFYNENFK